MVIEKNLNLNNDYSIFIQRNTFELSFLSKICLFILFKSILPKFETIIFLQCFQEII